MKQNHPLRKATHIPLLTAWFDSCPTDVMSKNHGSFHCAVFMLGNAKRLEGLIDTIHRKEPTLLSIVEKIDKENAAARMSKWAPERDCGRPHKLLKEYRRIIRRSLLETMREAACPAFVWSFFDAQVVDVWPKLCHSLGVKKSKVSECIKPDSKGRPRYSPPGSRPLAMSQYHFLMYVADSICSSLRAERKRDGDQTLCCRVISDLISGDCEEDQWRGQILRDLITKADQGRTSISFHPKKDLPIGVLLADNIAGMAHQLLSNPDDPGAKELWDIIERDDRPLIWHDSDQTFEAQQMTKQYAIAHKQRSQQASLLASQSKVTDALCPGEG